VLPATRQRWLSRLIQAEVGTRFSDPGGMQGWVGLGGVYNSQDSQHPWLKSTCFGKYFGQKRQFPATLVGAVRLEISLFCMVLRYWQTIIPFCHRWMDEQTDRQNCDSNTVRCITCSCPVNMQWSYQLNEVQKWITVWSP